MKKGDPLAFYPSFSERSDWVSKTGWSLVCYGVEVDPDSSATTTTLELIIIACHHQRQELVSQEFSLHLQAAIPRTFFHNISMVFPAAFSTGCFLCKKRKIKVGHALDRHSHWPGL